MRARAVETQRGRQLATQGAVHAGWLPAAPTCVGTPMVATTRSMSSRSQLASGFHTDKMTPGRGGAGQAGAKADWRKKLGALAAWSDYSHWDWSQPITLIRRRVTPQAKAGQQRVHRRPALALTAGSQGTPAPGARLPRRARSPAPMPGPGPRTPCVSSTSMRWMENLANPAGTGGYSEGLKRVWSGGRREGAGGAGACGVRHRPGAISARPQAGFAVSAGAGSTRLLMAWGPGSRGASRRRRAAGAAAVREPGRPVALRGPFGRHLSGPFA